MKKPRFTEAFLLQFYEFLEAVRNAHRQFAPRSWKDVFAPEWRELRIAYEKKRRARSFSQFISYLKRMGYIAVPQGESIGVLHLTAKGKKKAFEGKKKARTLPSRKDGKMIMLMYDIPKRKQHVRQAFRSALEYLDYQILQKSVWVSGKDVLEETEHAVREYGLDDCVNLFVIEKVKVQK